MSSVKTLKSLIELLVREQLNIGKEDLETTNAYKEGQVISVRELNNIFKVFHLSKNDIGSNFTFTPQEPKTPFNDEYGNVFEDDYTLRVSLAPSIHLAILALKDEPLRKYLYAGDLKKDPNDNIETINTKPNSKCPNSKNNFYGPEFDMVDWLKSKDLYDPDEDGYYRPSRLPIEYSDEFEGCVPDSEQTEEKWSLKPVTLSLIGHMVNKHTVRITSLGATLLNKNKSV